MGKLKMKTLGRRHRTILFLLITAVGAALFTVGCSDHGDASEQREDTEVVSDEAEDKDEVTTDNDGVHETREEDESRQDVTGTGTFKSAVASDNGLGGDTVCGAAINSQTINDDRVMELVYRHFNAVTLENELKIDCMLGYSNAVCPPGSLHEEELNGETITVPAIDHTRADRMLDIILAHNEADPDNPVRVRGHVLVWHSQTPEWFFHEDYDASKDYVSKDEMNKRLEWYISSMLGYYTGKDSKYHGLFYGWDVVNEAVSDASGSYRTDTEAGSDSLSDPVHSIKSSWWKVYQSNEFITNAFVYANRYADKDVELYYNDYNECNEKKMDGILELIEAVRNTPDARIDGFGMQGHYAVDMPGASDVKEAVLRYSETAGKVMFTEVDVKSNSDVSVSEEALKKEYDRQAGYYLKLYDAMKEAEKEGARVAGITTWGVIDPDSWLQTWNDVGGGADGKLRQCPLLFDGNYEPKPAFYAFTDPDRM